MNITTGQWLAIFSSFLIIFIASLFFIFSALRKKNVVINKKQDNFPILKKSNLEKVCRFFYLVFGIGCLYASIFYVGYDVRDIIYNGNKSIIIKGTVTDTGNAAKSLPKIYLNRELYTNIGCGAKKGDVIELEVLKRSGIAYGCRYFNK